MSATQKLLTRWMSATNVTNQSDAARRLGITPGGVNNWVAGRSQAAPSLIEKMARDIGEDPTGWLALIESERARDADDRKTWAGIAKRLGIAAALALCAIGTAIPLNLQASIPDSVPYVPILMAVLAIGAAVGTVLVRPGRSPIGGSYA